MPTTLSDAFSHERPVPYDANVRLKVVATAGALLSYTNKQREQRQSLTVAVADDATTAKCVVYDATKFARFRLGTTLSVRNFIKRDGMMVVTGTTKVFVIPDFTVPQERGVEGESLVNPPPAPQKSLDDALRSPSKQRVTVAGQLVQEDSVREVHIKDAPVQIKDVYLQDNTKDKVKVTLWRTDSIDAKTGDYIKITDCVVNAYKNEMSLASTSTTTVAKTAAPVERNTVVVIAASVEGEDTEVLLENGSVRRIPSEIFLSALPEGTAIEEYIINSAPLTLSIRSRGAEVLDVQIDL